VAAGRAPHGTRLQHSGIVNGAIQGPATLILLDCLYARQVPAIGRPAVDIALADAERALTVRPGRLRFAPAIEARFEADTGARRCRRLISATLLGMCVYLLSLMSDASLLPDVLGLAMIVKLGMVVPLFLLSLFVLKHNPRPWLRESLVTTTAIVIMAAHVYLLLNSASPLAMYAPYSAPIDIVFANLIVRARFWYALTASSASLAIYGLGIGHLAILPVAAHSGAIMVMAVVVACTLYANFQLERDERRAYAVGLRDEIRSRALSRANQELSRISNLDAMTGLANRRGFDRRFDAMWLAAQATAQPIAVLMLDVDYFKRFNDRYGHQAGDACLREIAETLRAQVRGGDQLVARYGGEEFIAVLPAADLVDGIRAAERVRRAVEALAMRHEATPCQVVTISVGVAAAPATPDGSPKDIIESADSALYVAKRRGRNRVWPPILSSDTAPAAEASAGKVADVA
jgi:diguanylate cyclase (GGDEF)-like protein